VPEDIVSVGQQQGRADELLIELAKFKTSSAERLELLSEFPKHRDALLSVFGKVGSILCTDARAATAFEAEFTAAVRACEQKSCREIVAARRGPSNTQR
jgi:hypothetical protein